MPKIIGDPLTKVTLNLFTADVEWFQENEGQGWSEVLREVIRGHVQRNKLWNENHPKRER